MKNCKPIFKDTEKEEKIIFLTGVEYFTSISCIPVSPGTVRQVRGGRWWSRPCTDRSPPSARGYTGSSRSPSPGRQARRTLSIKNTTKISILYCALSLLTKSCVKNKLLIFTVTYMNYYCKEELNVYCISTFYSCVGNFREVFHILRLLIWKWLVKNAMIFMHFKLYRKYQLSMTIFVYFLCTCINLLLLILTYYYGPWAW